MLVGIGEVERWARLLGASCCAGEPLEVGVEQISRAWWRAEATTRTAGDFARSTRASIWWWSHQLGRPQMSYTGPEISPMSIMQDMDNPAIDGFYIPRKFNPALEQIQRLSPRRLGLQIRL